MDYLIIIAVLSSTALIAAIVGYMLSKKNKKTVLLYSPKLAALKNLNSSTRFFALKPTFEIIKQYDNKSSYNRISPPDLMASYIRDNIDFFSDYAEKMRENRSAFADYVKEANAIFLTHYEVDYKKLDIFESSYDHHEKKLFTEMLLSPVVDCTFGVYMSYTSPKGRVSLSKYDIFCFDQLFASLESVSRSRLDRSTYEKLAAVERGEVSDSLRYDILNRDNFTCVICGASSKEGARLHVDHIIPISKGGKSVPENLRTLCERCNIGKSNKTEAKTQGASTTSTHAPTCGMCGAKLVLRNGKFGAFYGCSNYPNCKFTRPVEDKKN